MTVTDLAPTFLLLLMTVMTSIRASRLSGLRPVGRKAWCVQSWRGMGG